MKGYIQDDKNIICLSRHHSGWPGIGGTCGAERGKSRYWERWGTTVLLRVRERKK